MNKTDRERREQQTRTRSKFPMRVMAISFSASPLLLPPPSSTILHLENIPLPSGWLPRILECTRDMPSHLSSISDVPCLSNNNISRNGTGQGPRMCAVTNRLCAAIPLVCPHTDFPFSLTSVCTNTLDALSRLANNPGCAHQCESNHPRRAIPHLPMTVTSFKTGTDRGMRCGGVLITCDGQSSVVRICSEGKSRPVIVRAQNKARRRGFGFSTLPHEREGGREGGRADSSTR
jgi:hypothetical protein